MDGPRAIRITHEVVNVKPLVVLVARVMTPGRRRLEMVKLAHELDRRGSAAGIGDLLEQREDLGWRPGYRLRSHPPAPEGRRLDDDRIEHATKLEFEQTIE